MLAILSKKLVRGGAFRIMTDLQEGDAAFTELLSIAAQVGFQPVAGSGKSYFPDSWRDPEFKVGSEPQILFLLSIDRMF